MVLLIGLAASISLAGGFELDGIFFIEVGLACEFDAAVSPGFKQSNIFSSGR